MKTTQTTTLKANINSLQMLLEKNLNGPKSNSNLKNDLPKIIDSLAFYDFITSRTGFIELYFDLLPEYPTKTKTFNEVNRIYKRETGKLKYKTYSEFKTALNG